MYLILVCAHAGDFSLRGISSTAFDGVVYGVAPHNRCSLPGTDDGKVAYGYLARPEPPAVRALPPLLQHGERHGVASGGRVGTSGRC